MMIVVIFTVVFWIFELGWVMYTYAVMADAANEGVRYAVVHSGGDAAGTKAKVKTFAQTSLHDVERNLHVSDLSRWQRRATKPRGRDRDLHLRSLAQSVHQHANHDDLCRREDDRPMKIHRYRSSQRRSSQHGQTLIPIVIFIGLFLLAMLGVAADYTQVWAHRQMAQGAADAACEAGAADLYPERG